MASAGASIIHLWMPKLANHCPRTCVTVFNNGFEGPSTAIALVIA